MKIPGPDHPITIEPSRRRVRAAFERHVIADTIDAVVLREANYPPVSYLPMDDVDMSFLTKTDHHTYCPYKGEASYWSIYMDGRLAENAAWAYEEPYPSVAAIKGRIAFYANVADVYEVDETDLHRTQADDAGPATT
jgi:uncharacterized protein (DUF427 family)